MDLSVLFWGTMLRTGQLFIEASTTLLVGFLVAGVMRRMLGTAGIQRLFGGPGWKGLLRAWAVGTVLPVCSLGVIPIARELRRAGVRSGTIIAFVLAAPHINPLSLLYGLTLSEPIVIICFAAGSLVVALAAGMAWDRLFAKGVDDAPPVDELSPAPGPKRLAAVAVAAARESVGPSAAYIVVGILFTGVLAGLLPYGCLGRSMRHDDWTSPLLMTGIALPLYSGPLQGMMRLGLMFEHGNSVGAAFSLFELGIGLNVGMIAWLGGLFGYRRVVPWLAVVAAVTFGLAYASEPTLYFAHEEAGHTHAFDEWANPYVSNFAPEPAQVREKLEQKIGLLEEFALGGLGLLVVAGVALRTFDRAGRVEAWLTTKREEVTTRPVAVWNRSVPGPVLGGFALLGLIAFSVAALYIYYPAPPDVFDEIVQVKTEALVAVNTGHREEAIRQIQHWDLLTRKLQVGRFIRTGRQDEEQSKLTEDLRERLEDLRDALLAGDLPAAKLQVPQVETAHRRCRDAY